MVSETKKENWLLKVGGLGLCLSLLLFLFLGLNHEYDSSRNFSTTPLFVFIFGALIIAPLLEELAFRGVFTKKRRLKILSFSLILIFFLINLTNVLVYIPFLVYLFALVKRKFFDGKLLFISSAIFFSLLHYRYDDIYSINTFYQPLAQFSLALVLTWVVLNYNLKNAILIHFSWNFLFILLTVYGLQYPDKSKKSLKSDKMDMYWEKTSLVNNVNSRLEYNESEIKVYDLEARKVFSIIALKYGMYKDTIIKQKEPYVKYNITFRSATKNQSQRSKDLIILKMLKELVIID